MVVPEATNFVPPQPSANGLDAGKSTWARPSGASPNGANRSGFSSPEPASPEAQQTVTPRAAAAWKASSNCFMAWSVQFFSGLPQLIETTEGLLTLSWSARVTASRNPCDVFGAK